MFPFSHSFFWLDASCIAFHQFWIGNRRHASYFLCQRMKTLTTTIESTTFSWETWTNVIMLHRVSPFLESLILEAHNRPFKACITYASRSILSTPSIRMSEWLATVKLNLTWRRLEGDHYNLQYLCMQLHQVSALLHCTAPYGVPYIDFFSPLVFCMYVCTLL